MKDFWEEFDKKHGLESRPIEPTEDYWDRILNRQPIPDNAVSFGDDLHTGDRVYVTPDDLATHTQFIGRTRMGKSWAMEGWIRQHLLAPEKPGVVVLDPNGDLYRRLVAFCAANHQCNDIAQRLVLFDPTRSDYIIGYNPLRPGRRSIDCHALMTFEAILKVCRQNDFAQTPRLARWLYNTLIVLLSHQTSLLEARQILDPKPNNIRKMLVSSLEEEIFSPQVKDEWEWFEEQRETIMEERTESSMARIRFFLNNQILGRIFSQRSAQLDLERLLDGGGILLVNLEAYTRGGALTRDGSRLLGTLLISDLMGAAFSRPMGQRRPCYVYMDEFAQFSTPDLALILDTGRKYGLHLILAHQYLEQLKRDDDQLYFSVLTNTGTKAIMGGLTVPDAQTLAAEAFITQFDFDERKLELYRTYFEPRETTREVFGENWAAGENESWATAKGMVDSFVAGSSESAMPGISLWGMTTQTTSEQRAAGQSEQSAKSGGRSSMNGGSRAIVPFHELIERRELASVQFRSFDEQVLRMVQKLKSQPIQHGVFIKPFNQDRAQFIKFDTLPEADVPQTEVDSFVHQHLSTSPLYKTPEQVAEERRKYTDSLQEKIRDLGEITTDDDQEPESFLE